jgi:hypothetical protein
VKKTKKAMLHEYDCLLCRRIRTVSYKPDPAKDTICEFCVLFLKEHPRAKSDGKKMSFEEYMSTENGTLLRAYATMLDKKMEMEYEEAQETSGKAIP